MIVPDINDRLKRRKNSPDSPRGSSKGGYPTLKIRYRDLPHWEIDGAVYFITFKTWEKLELTPSARQIVLDACLFFQRKRYEIFVLVIMPDHVHMLIQPFPKEKLKELQPVETVQSGQAVSLSHKYKYKNKSKQKYWPLSSIMHSIKSYSAKKIPKVMTHIGKVWQPERYDHIVRNDTELSNFWEYIRQNPVKAELSNTPEAYPFFWQKTNDDCDRK